MGGTFDPIHNGHLVAASEVADLFELDEVVFVPTGQPWQKHHRRVTAAEDRYLMTVIATASNPRFSAAVTRRWCFCQGWPVGTNTTRRARTDRQPRWLRPGGRCGWGRTYHPPSPSAVYSSSLPYFFQAEECAGFIVAAEGATPRNRSGVDQVF